MSVDLSGGQTVNLSGGGGGQPGQYKEMNFNIDPNSIQGGGGGGSAASTAPSSGGGGHSAFTDNPMLAVAGSTAKMALDRSVDEIKNFIESNPSSVRVAVFAMALCTCVYTALKALWIFKMVFNPTEYVVNFYLFIFSATTLVLEGKPEWPFVAFLQEKIFYQAHFLSTVHGRALFYLFQGTFGMAKVDDEISVLFGFGFFVVGVLILVQQYKARGKAQHGLLSGNGQSFEARENALVNGYNINP